MDQKRCSGFRRASVRCEKRFWSSTSLSQIFPNCLDYPWQVQGSGPFIRIVTRHRPVPKGSDPAAAVTAGQVAKSGVSYRETRGNIMRAYLTLVLTAVVLTGCNKPAE